MRLSRRHALTGLAASAAAGFTPGARLTADDAGPSVRFDPAAIRKLAQKRAKAGYKPVEPVPGPWRALSFDQYRDIRYAAEPIWDTARQPFALRPLPAGYGFRRPVALHLVRDGVAKTHPFRMQDFAFGPKAPPLPAIDGLGHSGFQLMTMLNRMGVLDEFAVFHGASYFRAVARGQAYGLSARGLAIDTVRPGQEEFPDFQHCWLEEPAPGARMVKLHALMDSPSIAGAFTFEITPGDATVMDVEARLFPRRDLGEAGIAPLTSMFFFNGGSARRFDDYRPAAHDSDGLMMLTGSGLRLWRPLQNHKTFEVSAFMDENPRGFGLMQRAREWDDFADLALDYHKRPSLWIEPKGDWGPGHVILVEIPVDREDIDNIVAYWRPEAPLMAGQEYRFAYRMSWCDAPDVTTPVMEVADTFVGPHHEGGRLMVIDFEGDGPAAGEIEPEIWATAGEIHFPVLQENPHTGGKRLFFGLHPGDARVAELGATLKRNGAALSETWLYRWTA